MARKINKLFTIILTNYNNTKYIYTALDSIFCQDYNNIELIITDDGSNDFDKDKIEKYILKNKSKNIKRINFIFNSKNIGTVKTLNKALKKSQGNYIIFFASDDKLANSKVISNFVYQFDNRNESIITSQWKICDENLKVLSNYVNKFEAKKYNIIPVINQHYRLCYSNPYGSGATSYRKEVFEKYGYFDEKYKLLEDWPYWLMLVSKNERIYYADFDGLLHRKGGISQSQNYDNCTRQFHYEILNTFEQEIIPNLYRFNIFKKLKILKSYNSHIQNYSNIIDTSFYKNSLKNILASNNELKFFWSLDKIMPNVLQKIEILFKYNITIPLSVILTLLFIIIIINQFEISKNILFTVYIISYIFIYYLTKIFYNIYKLVRRKQ